VLFRSAELYERALAINEKVLKVCDTDAARTRHNLAILYDRTGRTEQADCLWAEGRRRYEADLTRITNEKEIAR
jgi:Flp pilus assembly protein TadD